MPAVPPSPYRLYPRERGYCRAGCQKKSFCSRLSQCLLPDRVDLAHENWPLPKNRYRSGTFLSMASDQAGFGHRATQLSFRVRITASSFRHPLHLQSGRICRADSEFVPPIMVTAPRLLLLGAAVRSVARILLRSPPIRYLPRGGRKCQPAPHSPAHRRPIEAPLLVSYPVAAQRVGRNPRPLSECCMSGMPGHAEDTLPYWLYTPSRPEP